jgi:hypothetical protein
VHDKDDRKKRTTSDQAFAERMQPNTNGQLITHSYLLTVRAEYGGCCPCTEAAQNSCRLFIAPDELQPIEIAPPEDWAPALEQEVFIIPHQEPVAEGPSIETVVEEEGEENQV